jgi:hypothetical protein
LEGAPVVRLIEAWLERTPCLVKQALDMNGKRYEQNYFLDEFRRGFDRYILDTFVKPYEVETFLSQIFIDFIYIKGAPKLMS